MEKIYILGIKELSTWASNFEDDRIVKFVDVPNISTIELEIIDKFIFNTFMHDDNNNEKAKCIIIDLDVHYPSLMLNIAMHIRLSVEKLKKISFLPIILVSYLPIQTFLKLGDCSQIFLSRQGVYFCEPDDVKYAVKECKGLTAENYKNYFLNNIIIRPDAKTGHHALANQWGVSLLADMANIQIKDPEIIKAKRTLYFKYLNAKNSSIKDIIDNTNKTISIPKNLFKDSRILFIDDRAKNGWEQILKELFVGATIDTIDKTVNNFDEYSDDEKNKILSDRYNLILLDLRLNTEEEKETKSEYFSGLDVLKKIKEKNPGQQVIIFTASNKAWNFKNMSDNGADGYYVKESPEYGFSREISRENYDSFIKEIRKCLKRDKLKIVYKKLSTFKSKLEDFKDEKFEERVSLNLDSAFYYFKNAYYVESEDLFKKNISYSFLQLFYIIEDYLNLETVLKKENGIYYVVNDNKKYQILSESNDVVTSEIKFNQGGYYTKEIDNSQKSFDNLRNNTNFKMSAVLIFKYDLENTKSHEWIEISSFRNKTAHGGKDLKQKDKSKYISAHDNIIDFLEKYIFC